MKDSKKTNSSMVCLRMMNLFSSVQNLTIFCKKNFKSRFKIKISFYAKKENIHRPKGHFTA
jgi:hypothetical protein